MLKAVHPRSTNCYSTIGGIMSKKLGVLIATMITCLVMAVPASADLPGFSTAWNKTRARACSEAGGCSGKTATLLSHGYEVGGHSRYFDWEVRGSGTCVARRFWIGHSYYIWDINHLYWC
jgi:hypothetical protein